MTGTDAVTWKEIAQTVTVLTALVGATWYLRSALGRLWGAVQGLSGKLDVVTAQVGENTKFRQSHGDGDRDKAVAIARLDQQMEDLSSKVAGDLTTLLNRTEHLRFGDSTSMGGSGE